MNCFVFTDRNRLAGAGLGQISTVLGRMITAAILVAPSCVLAQLSPIYADFGIAGKACCTVADGSGGWWVAGNYDPNSVSAPGNRERVIHLDASGKAVYVFTSGIGATVNAIALDPGGTLVVAGQTMVPPPFAQTGPQYVADGAIDAAFIQRFNASGMISSTLISGGPLTQTSAGNAAFAVAIGPDHFIYVAGAAVGDAFPTTPGALQRAKAGNFAFIAKLTPDAGAIAWATLLGGTERLCYTGPALCASITPASAAVAIAVDANGFATVAGNTTTSDFPVTDQSGGGIFVARLNPTGTGLVWSTHIAAPWQSPTAGAYLGAMAMDGSGNPVVAGSTASGSFVAKLNVSSGAVLWSSLLWPGGQTGISSIGVRADGDIIADGVTFDPAFPVTAGVPASGADFVAVLDSSGALVNSFRAPAGSADGQIVPGPGSAVTLLGTGGSVLTLPSTPPPSPVLLGVVNSGGTRVSPQVSPGGFVSFYGQGLGPSAPAGAVVNGSALATRIGGVQVFFDDVAAPLLYARSTQINAIVPFEVAGRGATAVRIETPAGTLPTFILPVVPATPAIFAITHLDGTVLSDAHPARAGEVLVMYAGGAGLFTPSLKTGELVSTTKPWPAPVLPVVVDGDILYAGAAPGLVAGALQVNFRLSESGVPNALQIGDTMLPQ